MEDTSEVTVIDRGEGIRVLVTAGSDGDEYDGIEAAKQLIDIWKKDMSWVGWRMVVPVVNRLGYEVGVSYDPLTHIFPKHTIPIFWQDLPVKPELWIDLHGGNRNESLMPFVWGFPHGPASLRNKTQQVLNVFSHTTTVYSPWQKAQQVAEQGCVYLVFESGEKGMISVDSIQRHLAWVDLSIHGYWHPHEQQKQHIDKIEYLAADCYGFWKPSVWKELQVGRRQICGKIHNGSTIKRVISLHSGKILWHHIGGWVTPGEIVVAVGVC